MLEVGKGDLLEGKCKRLRLAPNTNALLMPSYAVARSSSEIKEASEIIPSTYHLTAWLHDLFRPGTSD